MDNQEFDDKVRDIAIMALSDAYAFASDAKSLEGLVKTAELAGKMIDFREPAREVGFRRGGKDDKESNS